PLWSSVTFGTRHALWAGVTLDAWLALRTGLVPGNQRLPTLACGRLRRVEQRQYMLSLHLLVADAARDDPVRGRNGGIRDARQQQSAQPQPDAHQQPTDRPVADGYSTHKRRLSRTKSER